MSPSSSFPTWLGILFGVALRRLAWVACLLAVSAVDTAAALPGNIPNFRDDSVHTLIQSAQTGTWSDPATWVGGVVPTGNHVVQIMTGHTVTIADTNATAWTVSIDGKLAFATGVNTRLLVVNLQVMAGEHGMGPGQGILEVGTAATPIAATVTAEIVFRNEDFGIGVSDPEQFGRGITAFGTVTMHGSIRTPTFLRVAVEPLAGHTTLTLAEAPTGWRVGDRIVLPDTRHLQWNETTNLNAVNQWEERTITAISGATVTLDSPLTYNHFGARDWNDVLWPNVGLLPHVGNLTRNVILRQESTSRRGHVLLTHRADVDIRYVLFQELGRTTFLPMNHQGGSNNQIGRYPLHIHHLAGPQVTPANGYQFTLLGNSVDGGTADHQLKWGITVHASHYGLVQDNIVYNYGGASFATEDGSESFNVFDHNYAIRGLGQPSDLQLIDSNGDGIGDGLLQTVECRTALGTEAVGFWFRGPHNYVRNNVAANFQNAENECAFGFVFQFRGPSSSGLGTIRVPKFKGADTVMGPASDYTNTDGNNLPILEFDNNEAYGAMQGGLTFWWVNSGDPAPKTTATETVIKDFKMWNVFNRGIYGYPAQKITFDGLTIRGRFNNLSKCCGSALYFGDYSSKGIVIKNSSIQGMGIGITTPSSGYGPEPNMTIENTTLRNDINLQVASPSSVISCFMDNMLVVTNNVTFQTPPGVTQTDVQMAFDVANAPKCFTKLDELRIFNHNGVSGDNFQVYHPDPAILPRPPVGCTSTRPGMTGLLDPIVKIQTAQATVCALALPAVTSVDPSTPTVTAGQPVVLTATVTGTPAPETFQWHVSTDGGATFTAVPNTSPYSNGTTTALTISGTPADFNTRRFKLVATNAQGSGESAHVVLTVNTLPAIASLASSPSTPTVNSGANITFTANDVTGSPAPSVKWQVSTDEGSTFTDIANGGQYSGATTATLTITGATRALNNYRYRARAANAAGTVDSTPLTLTVNAAAPAIGAIASSPATPTINSGGSITFTVSGVTGDPEPTLQWQESTNGGMSWSALSNGGVYSGVTTSTLTISGATYGLTGFRYRAAAFNVAGTVDSTPLTLTVNAAAPAIGAITSSPTIPTVTAGGNVTFTVSGVTGDPPPGIQWQVDSGAGFQNLANSGVYSGVTSTSLTIAGATFALNGYKYRALASNAGGAIPSAERTLTVNTVPAISTHPVSQTGTTTVWTVAATGSPVPTIQWQVSTNGGASFGNISDSSTYSGATTATLTITTTSSSLNGAQYRAVATNAAGSAISNAGTLTVLQAPTISSHPAGRTMPAGDNASFSVVAAGVPSPTVQWQSSADGVTFTNLSNGSLYAGTTTTQLQITAAPISLNGTRYRAVVSNSSGTATSGAALLTVTQSETLTVGVTAIRVLHISELRTRIDAVRVRFKLGAFAWTDNPLVAGVTPIKAQHLLDLRTALQQAATAAGTAPPVFADTIQRGVVIKASHINEIRAALTSLEGL